jgi:hypothetical protein
MTLSCVFVASHPPPACPITVLTRKLFASQACEWPQSTDSCFKFLLQLEASSSTAGFLDIYLTFRGCGCAPFQKLTAFEPVGSLSEFAKIGEGAGGIAVGVYHDQSAASKLWQRLKHAAMGAMLPGDRYAYVTQG